MALAFFLAAVGFSAAGHARAHFAKPCAEATMLSGHHGTAHGETMDGSCCLFHCVPVANLALLFAPAPLLRSARMPLVPQTASHGVTPPVLAPPPRS